MWFIYTLATLLLWGGADLFYKISADEADKFSHLKTSATVGIVMGIHAFITLIFGGIGYDFRNLLIYLPVSSMYILSMTIGYFGLRYIEVSISSPIQNTSGVIVCLLCLVILGEKTDLISSVAVAVICVSVFMLGVLEKRSEPDIKSDGISGLKAFMMPILYCIFDALGTFFDAYYLDSIDTTPLLGVTDDTFEQVANVSYELTFFIIAIILIIYMKFVEKVPLGFSGSGSRISAAVFETAGQFTYVYAMSGKAVIAAPVIAAYCIVSVLLGRVFLKEKLTQSQYLLIAAVTVGIILLGIAEI